METANDFDMKKAIATFKNFCVFFETYPLINEQEYFQELRKQLLEIYSQALLLPANTGLSDNEYDKVSAEDIAPRLLAIAELINHRFYWEVFDPYDDNDTEAVCGDIIDDLGDTYRDIKNAINFFDTANDESIKDTLWKLEFGFKHHWGNHCMDALRACHNVFSRLK